MAFGKEGRLWGPSFRLLGASAEAVCQDGRRMSPDKEQQVRDYYQTLSRAWGEQHWWPARSRFEVIVGAFLTQNTAWTNVERALRRLRTAGCLSLAGIRRVPLAELEGLIRSAGYFRLKAYRLKAFVAWLDERHGGSLTRMFKQPTGKLREELLALHGIGQETADSILLYAGQHAVFVVDAYTRRIFERHGIASATASYENIRDLVERALARMRWEQPAAQLRPSQSAAHSPSPMSLAKRSPRAQVYNEMHGLMVGVGKYHCLKSKPKCDGCPLQIFLPSMK